MAYTYSKTNWVDTDTFEVADWRRIRDNYYAIYEGLVRLSVLRGTTLPDIVDVSSSLSMPYFSDVNDLESALQYMYTEADMPIVEWRARVTWTYRTSASYAQVGNPSFEDFNRWETFILGMYNILDYLDTYENNIICGTSFSGNDLGLQHFTRGRY